MENTVVKKSVAFLTAALASLSLAAGAQVVCPGNFPSPNSLASNSLIDIPATNDNITTSGGGTAKARVNHNFAYVEITPNDQRVWFSVDTGTDLHRTYYNRRTRNSASAPWKWQYSYSPAVIEYPSPSTVNVTSVLYSDTPKYFDTVTGTAYKFLMYQNYQPGSCNGVVAGFLYHSYSNDGICWTTPRQVVRSGGPSFPCLPGHANTLPIEQAAALDGGNTLYLVGVEGDINQLAPPVTQLDTDNFTPRRYNLMNRTQTALAWASPNDPGTITLFPSPELSANGMFIPNVGPNNSTNDQRYKGYAYFMNLHIAYDAANGDLYMGRGYPYPYDRGSAETAGWIDPPAANNTPLDSQLATCADSPYTFPNRIQIYRMHIGALGNIGQITSGTWTLVTDQGGAAGYGFDSPFASSTALIPGQTNAGRDYGAVSFLRDRGGNLVRTNGVASYFPADTFATSKAVGPCLTTGTERIFLHTLP
jgi:hypothetical protein